MSKEVAKVTDVASRIANVGKRAESVAEDLDKNITDVEEALDMAQEMSTSLRNTGAALRGVLGVQTNSAPAPKLPRPAIVGTSEPPPAINKVDGSGS